MSIEVYDQVYPYLNGALLSDATQVSTEIRGTNQEVSTLVKKFAGFTPGPKMREVTVESVVPLSGSGLEVEGYFLRDAIVTLKLLNGGSGKTYEGKGFFTTVKIDSGVGKTTTLSFTFMGEAKEFV